MSNIKQMQGVSAHLEIVKSKDKRRHSCKSCCYYSQGRCLSMHSVYFECSHCTARYCKYYKYKTEKSNKKYSLKNTKNKEEKIVRHEIEQKRNGKLFYGDSFEVMDLKTREKFKIDAIKKDPKSNAAKNIKGIFLNKSVGDIVQYSGYKYKIVKIL